MAAIKAERPNVLVAETGCLQRHPQHCVDQVVLAVEHLTGWQARAFGPLDEHAPAVGEEGHERHALHLLRGRVSPDQPEHSMAG